METNAVMIIGAVNRQLWEVFSYHARGFFSRQSIGLIGTVLVKSPVNGVIGTTFETNFNIIPYCKIGHQISLIIP